MLFAGKYELQAPLGEGAMGVVYRARHILLDLDMAVKVLRPQYSADESFRKRFMREARIPMAFVHKRSVTLRDFGVGEDGALYLAMDLCPGQPLSQVIKQAGRLDPERVVSIALQVLEVLIEAHAVGILHRDIKPDNIMVAGTQGVDQVKVMDFGIAKLMEGDAHQTNLTAGSAIGTPLYMSPEQAAGEHLDQRSDLYGLGVVMFEMLTGAPPFQSERVQALLMKHLTQPVPPTLQELGVDIELTAIVHKTLAKTAQERYVSATELSQVLMRWLEHFRNKPLSETLTAEIARPEPAPELGMVAGPLAAPPQPITPRLSDSAPFRGVRPAAEREDALDDERMDSVSFVRPSQEAPHGTGFSAPEPREPEPHQAPIGSTGGWGPLLRADATGEPDRSAVSTDTGLESISLVGDSAVSEPAGPAIRVEPRGPEAAAEPRSPESRSPEPRSPDPRSPDSRSPETRPAPARAVEEAEARPSARKAGFSDISSIDHRDVAQEALRDQVSAGSGSPRSTIGSVLAFVSIPLAAMLLGMFWLVGSESVPESMASLARSVPGLVRPLTILPGYSKLIPYLEEGEASATTPSPVAVATPVPPPPTAVPPRSKPPKPKPEPTPVPTPKVEKPARPSEAGAYRLELSSLPGDSTTAYVPQNKVLLAGEVPGRGTTAEVNGDEVYASDGRFVATLALRDGSNTVRIVGRGDNGSSTLNLDVIVDKTKPVLDIDNMSTRPIVRQPSFEIRGKVKEANLKRVTIDGKEVEVTNGRFAQSYDLAGGMNNILVVAEDLAGNKVTRKLDVRHPPPGMMFPDRQAPRRP